MFRVVFLAFFGTAPAHAPAAHGAARRARSRTRARRAGRHVAARCGSWRSLALAIGVYFTLHHLEPEFESPGVADAGGGRRSPLGGILLAWLTYQRQAISADALASAFGPIRRAAHREASGSTTRFCWRLSRRPAGVRARRRLDRPLHRRRRVNVISAWTRDGRRRSCGGSRPAACRTTSSASPWACSR